MGFNKKFFTTGGIVAASSPSGITNTDNFSIITYTGTGSAQSTNSLSSQSGTVDFAPDFIWVKSRSGGFNNMLTDSINGDNTFLISNTTATLDTNSSAPQFNTNGFTLGAGNNNWNGTSHTYVAWCWKAGGAKVSGTGTNGVTSVNQSANTDAGFSIVEFSTPASGNGTATHGLSQAPEFIIYKKTSGTGQWIIYHSALGVHQFLFFTSAAAVPETGVWSTPSSTTIPANVGVNVSASSDYIAYCFHSVNGYQKIGTYTGTSGSVTVSDVGFQPRWIMISRTEGAGDWEIVDSVRGDGGFDTAKILEAGNAGVEFTDDDYGVTFTSTGFTIPSGAANSLNVNGEVFIYLAIA